MTTKQSKDIHQQQLEQNIKLRPTGMIGRDFFRTVSTLSLLLIYKVVLYQCVRYTKYRSLWSSTVRTANTDHREKNSIFGPS